MIIQNIFNWLFTNYVITIAIIGIVAPAIWFIIDYRTGKKNRRKDWLEKIKPVLRVEKYEFLSYSAMNIEIVNDGGDCYNCTAEDEVRRLTAKFSVPKTLTKNARFSSRISTAPYDFDNGLYEINFKFFDCNNRQFNQVLSFKIDRYANAHLINFDVPVLIT